VVPEADRISLGININMTEMEPYIQTYQDAFESLIEGMTIEEAAADFPRIFNTTTYAVLDPTVIEFNGMRPIYEAVYRSPNGTAIVLEVFNDPEVLKNLFFTLTSNFEWSSVAGGDQPLIVTNYILSIAAPLLVEPF